MTRTAVATGDGDEPDQELLGEIAAVLRKHGHADADDVWTEIHALADKVDKLTELTRNQRCCGHTYWYPATATYTTGTTVLPSSVTYGTTPFTT